MQRRLIDQCSACSQSKGTSKSRDKGEGDHTGHVAGHLGRNSYSSVGRARAGGGSRDRARDRRRFLRDAADLTASRRRDRRQDRAEVCVARTTIGEDRRSERKVRVGNALLRRDKRRLVCRKRGRVNAGKLRADVGRERSERSRVGVLREVVRVEAWSVPR